MYIIYIYNKWTADYKKTMQKVVVACVIAHFFLYSSWRAGVGEVELSLRQHPSRHAHPFRRRHLRGLARVRPGTFLKGLLPSDYSRAPQPTSSRILLPLQGGFCVALFGGGSNASCIVYLWAQILSPLTGGNASYEVGLKSTHVWGCPPNPLSILRHKVSSHCTPPSSNSPSS